MRRRIILAVLSAGIVGTIAGVAQPANLAISIGMSGVTAKSGERGSYYVVKIDLPPELTGKRLDSALLEFAVDAAPLSPAEAGATPEIAVFPLTAEFTDASLNYDAKVPSVQNIPMGEGQVVMDDITSIVKDWLANPSSNHGLVIGALTGPEVGAVSLNDTVLGAGSALRVTFFYQNRFGGRVSTK